MPEIINNIPTHLLNIKEAVKMQRHWNSYTFYFYVVVLICTAKINLNNISLFQLQIGATFLYFFVSNSFLLFFRASTVWALQRWHPSREDVFSAWSNSHVKKSKRNAQKGNFSMKYNKITIRKQKKCKRRYFFDQIYENKLFTKLIKCISW